MECVMVVIGRKFEILVMSTVFLCVGFIAADTAFKRKVQYCFKDEPIDVVIPAIKKDLATLELCIEGIRKNCVGVRNIYVISKKKLTDKAFWFCEDSYPFSKQSIGSVIFEDPSLRKHGRIGWIFQQLLKLYAPFVIPDISSNVLVVDSDTIFLHPTTFLTEDFEPLFNPSTEYHKPYFEHAKKLIEGFERILPYSGISHHMLLQKSVLEHLFAVVREQHGVEFWEAFSQCIRGVGLSEGLTSSPCSEFEIYFNFILSTSHQAHVRELEWDNVETLSQVEKYREIGHNYVSAHEWMRQA